MIDKQLINYKKSGEGDIPVIFLHGWRSEGSVWLKILETLNSNFTGYAPDLPGFGSSPLAKESYDLADYVELVLAFIQKLKLINPVIVGHSFGGRIAIKLTAGYPSIASKLVLVDSAGFVEKINPSHKLLAKLVKPMFKPTFMQGIRKTIYKAIGSDDYLATPELQKTFVNIINEDLEPIMKNILVPALLIWGELDQATPLDYGKRMNHEIRGSRLIVLDGATHFSFLDKPEEFSSQLNTFLND